jgi:uncharacterized protein YycO
VIKKICSLVLLFVLMLSVFTVEASAFNYPNGTPARPGDILVTSDAWSKGIVGHAALVTGADEYLEIRGANHYPEIRKLNKFFDYKGKEVKVVRIGDSVKAIDAALYGRLYNGSKIPYKITTNLLDSKYMYCSKLVYQAYAFGTSGVFPIIEGPRMITPYDLLYRQTYKRGVKLKLVYSKGIYGMGDIF